MTSLRLRIFFAGLIVAVLAPAGLADDASVSPQFVAIQKKKETKTKKPRKFRGRLPQYYGQIGLSDKQRKSIYSIQLSYRERLLALEKQLRELRAKQSSEIDAVLTSEQKQKLSDVREAARKKRSARKGSKGKKTDKKRKTVKKAT